MQPQIFRPRSNLVIAGLLGAGIAGFAAAAVLDDVPVLVVGAYALAAALTVHLLFVRPCVHLDDMQVRIVNPLQTVTATWDRVRTIDARYSVYFDIDGRRVTAWAGPAPSRYHARSVHAAELRGLRLADPNVVRAAESPRADSGVLLHLARLQKERHAATAGGHVTVQQRPLPALIAVALVAAAVLVSMLHG